MRILFVSNFYPPHDLGGMEQLCQETVDGLRERGHKCHVLTSQFGVRNSPESEVGVARALRLEADIHYYRPLDFFLHHGAQQRVNRQAVRATLDAFQPDVVFVWGMWNLSRGVAYWAEQWLPGRVAYAMASYWPMEPDVDQAYWMTQARRFWARALMAPARALALHLLARERTTQPLALKQVACVSEYVRWRLTGAGVLPHGARVIHNGIDPQPYLVASTQPRPNSDSLKLVYTGTLSRQKGVHTAVEALGVLQGQGRADGLHLSVVGGGHPSYEAGLRRRANELGLHGRVLFHGRVPHSEIANILAGYDVFLFTSVWEEPIARSVLEAMASGLAVVGTAVGGQREMLEDGVNALVFPPEDANSLAESILRLRRDPDLRAKLAEAGRRTVLARFTLRRMMDETEAWLARIAEGED